MNLRIWRLYALRFRGSGSGLALGAVLAFATGLTLVPIPLLVGYAFDRIIPAGQIQAIVGVAAAILTLHLLNGAFALWTRAVILRVTKRVVGRLRVEAVTRLLSASRSYYSAHDRAALHDIVVQESERIDVMSNSLLAELWPAFVLSLGVSAVLFTLNWKLFLTMLLILPLNVIAARRLGWAVRQSIARFHESFKRFSEGILFVVRAIDLTRIQAAENTETVRQTNNIEELRGTSSSMSILGTSYTVVQQTLIAVGGVIVLVAGGIAVTTRTMTIGNLLSYFAGLMLLRAPLNIMMASLPRIMEGRQSLAAIMEVFDGIDREPYEGKASIAFTGAVAMRGVSFAYGSKRVLDNVSLTIRPGETVALVGPNGSGKSTIVSLILGFYRPQEGSVVADDCSYDDVDMVELRKSIGVVMQDPIMVPGSIRDNLTYGVPRVTDEEIAEVSRLAGVDRFVSRLDCGFDTNIGEDGNLLSGGQRQRVALARALVGRPKLLILDEPMNHLDEADGAAFLGRLMAGARPPAILLISHRDEVLSIAHRVYRIDGGRVAEMPDRRALAAATAFK